MSQVTCFSCGITGERKNDEEWNIKKAIDEFMELTPQCKDDELVEVCDDCFQLYKIWLSKQTKEYKERMRREG